MEDMVLLDPTPEDTVVDPAFLPSLETEDLLDPDLWENNPSSLEEEITELPTTNNVNARPRTPALKDLLDLPEKPELLVTMDCPDCPVFPERMPKTSTTNPHKDASPVLLDPLDLLDPLEDPVSEVCADLRVNLDSLDSMETLELLEIKDLKEHLEMMASPELLERKDVTPKDQSPAEDPEDPQENKETKENKDQSERTELLASLDPKDLKDLLDSKDQLDKMVRKDVKEIMEHLELMLNTVLALPETELIPEAVEDLVEPEEPVVPVELIPDLETMVAPMLTTLLTVVVSVSKFSIFPSV